jgi:hypothetical protein
VTDAQPDAVADSATRPATYADEAPALSPAVVFLAALAWVVQRWRRARSTWWIPLVAVVAGAVVWFGGALITFSAVG